MNILYVSSDVLAYVRVRIRDTLLMQVDRHGCDWAIQREPDDLQVTA